MVEINNIKSYLKDTLSEKRFKHSLGVAQEAALLAERYNADSEKAYLAGLVHDCAKEIDEATAKDLIINTYKLSLDDISLQTHKLLHGPLGACIAKEMFGISDSEILDAIIYHTTAKPDMSILTKIIYIADYIEPNRSFDGVEELRKIAYEDIDQAIIIGLDYTIGELINAKKMLHPDTVNARNFLLIGK